MPAKPHVSIVLCTYNRPLSLRVTLDALNAQRTPFDLRWELLVIDNNSTDSTRGVIEEFAARARMPVRHVFEPAQGLSHARNVGVAESEGAVVAFTDDDVHPASDWVAKIVSTMSKTGADVLGGRILAAWDGPAPAWLRDPAFQGLLTIMDDPRRTEVLNAHRRPCVWGANMAFRRTVLERIGPFDTRRGICGRRRYGGEETEFVARALAAGYRVIYDPSVVVWHRIGRDRMRIAYLSRVSFQRAEGEARVRHVARPLPGLGGRLGACRSVTRQFARWAAAAALRRPDSVKHWLELCRVLGSMWGACRRRVDKARRRAPVGYETLPER
jgi:glycosyltransferase involved in cell wall biosynthesis